MEETLTIRSAGGLELNLSIAGLGSRSYAFIIDWHIRLLLALAWLFVVFLVGGLLSAAGSLGEVIKEAGGSKAFMYLGVLPSAIIYVFYHPVLEILMKGRTPGKRMAGIRIVTLEGDTPSIGALLIRNLFRLIDNLPAFYILGMIVVMFTPKQVRIGDIAARTLLVYEDKVATESLAQVAEASGRNGLDHAKVEVLHELLARWAELDSVARQRLGGRLLIAAGDALPDGPTDNNQRDQALHEKLLALQQRATGYG